MLTIDVRRRLGNFTLDISLNVGCELAVLLGRSGAGKSVTLRAVAGLMTPDTGHIALNGRALFDSDAHINLPPQARRIGYVPQSYALFPHMSAEQNIAYALKGLPRDEAERRVAEMVSLVGLMGMAERRPDQLSGGQQQRVALARALARQPDALLLDEPLSALDAPTRADLRRNLRQLQARFQIPVLFVTHDLAEAYFMADRLAVYGEGRILQFDAPGVVLRHPANRRVAQLMGVKNVFDAKVIGRDGPGLRVCVGEVEMVTPPMATEDGRRKNPSMRGGAAGDAGQKTEDGSDQSTNVPRHAETSSVPGLPSAVSICIRSERVLLVRPERLSGERENLMQGRIVGEMNDGTMAVLSFRLDGLRLTPEREHDLEIELPVYVYERLNLATDREWHVSIKRDAMHVIAEEET
jgi:molybdate transport system ATP-binding protein